MATKDSVFTKLNKVDVKPFVKEKNKLSYISWASAWRLIVELYPAATYELKTYDDGVPCKMTPYGAFVSTSVIIEGITREMTLPVLDGANKPLKETSYEYTNKYGSKTVDAVNAFDINKAQMRCLVKNLAVFGLGIDLYIGYDLPDNLHLEEKIDNISIINKLLKETATEKANFLTYFKVSAISQLSYEAQLGAITMLNKKIADREEKK